MYKRQAIPTNNADADLLNQGIYRSGDSASFTGTTATPTIYISLPTRAQGYNFRTGLAFIRGTPVTATFVQAGYTLYDLGTLNDNETLTVEVTDG